MSTNTVIDKTELEFCPMRYYWTLSSRLVSAGWRVECNRSKAKHVRSRMALPDIRPTASGVTVHFGLTRAPLTCWRDRGA